MPPNTVIISSGSSTPPDSNDMPKVEMGVRRSTRARVATVVDKSPSSPLPKKAETSKAVKQPAVKVKKKKSESKAKPSKVPKDYGADTKWTVASGEDELEEIDYTFGEALPEEEARAKYGVRYVEFKGNHSNWPFVPAVRHYSSVTFENVLYKLGDNVYVSATECPNFVGRLIEIYASKDKQCYVTLQWYFRSYDTKMKAHGPALLDYRAVWLSGVQNVNGVDSLVGHADIVFGQPPEPVELRTYYEGNHEPFECGTHYCWQSYAYECCSFFDLPPDYVEIPPLSPLKPEELPLVIKKSLHLASPLPLGHPSPPAAVNGAEGKCQVAARGRRASSSAATLPSAGPLLTAAASAPAAAATVPVAAAPDAAATAAAAVGAAAAAADATIVGRAHAAVAGNGHVGVNAPLGAGPEYVIIPDSPEEGVVKCPLADGPADLEPVTAPAAATSAAPAATSAAAAAAISAAPAASTSAAGAAVTSFAGVPPGTPALPVQQRKLVALDVYAGCGAMSTGIEMGAPLAQVTIHTRYAVDFNKAATESYKLNHPGTEVRHEKADEFLLLLQAWAPLVKRYTGGDDSTAPSLKEEERGAGVGPAKARRTARESTSEDRVLPADDDMAKEEEAMMHEDEVFAEEDELAAVEAEEGRLAALGKRKGRGAPGGGGAAKEKGATKGKGVAKGKGKGKEKEKIEEEAEEEDEKAPIGGGRGEKRKNVKEEHEEEEERDDAAGRAKRRHAETGAKGRKEEKEEEEGEEYEVARLVNIRWAGSQEDGHLQYKVRWKGYSEAEDTWEHVENLGSCKELIREFIIEGAKKKILPLPGDLDLLCGGPPCQGVSGFNRFRDRADPLADEKNRQLLTYMSLVEFLRPKWVIMENVVDMLKFADGTLAHYAIARLVSMRYQCQTGMLAAGAFGLPQFRMRTIWLGAQAGLALPSFPLPTSMVHMQRNHAPVDWQQNFVAWEEAQLPAQRCHAAVTLRDALTDLPPVKGGGNDVAVEYKSGPQTRLQAYLRLPKGAFIPGGRQAAPKLVDHLSLRLTEDDLCRVTQIPRRKGACFRDLKGVMTDPRTNKVFLDPTVKRPMLNSGKPLCPDYAISFVRGTSFKPFARMWWDETVPTVVTRAEPHNQKILHPEEDRVLSVRENARLQGFPDHYKLAGTLKERYCQVGNAVAVPLAQALGYSVGLAARNIRHPRPIHELPQNFPFLDGPQHARELAEREHAQSAGV